MQIVGTCGQDADRGMKPITLALPPRTPVQIDDEFFTLAYIPGKSLQDVRIGIHGPARRETHLIGKMDWGNIRV